MFVTFSCDGVGHCNRRLASIYPQKNFFRNVSNSLIRANLHVNRSSLTFAIHFPYDGGVFVIVASLKQEVSLYLTYLHDEWNLSTVLPFS